MSMSGLSNSVSGPLMSVSGQGFIQRGGGTGGIYPPHDFGKGEYPPHQTAEQCFLMAILVKSFKKVFRRQIPFFSKFVFSNCLPV